MKKIILLCLIIFTIGCNNDDNLSELTIIKSIGITYDKAYSIYAQVIDHLDENNKPIMKTIKEEGNTINDTFSNLKKKINKKVYFAHVDLLVLDNNLNNDNYQSIINYFINNIDFRNDFYCIYSPNVKNLLEQSTYDEVEIFLKKNNKILIKNFDNVMQEFFEDKKIILSNITYQDEIVYLGNIQYNMENHYE